MKSKEREDTAKARQWEDTIVKKIAEVGYVIIQGKSNQGSAGVVDLVYTAGLADIGLPELSVCYTTTELGVGTMVTRLVNRIAGELKSFNPTLPTSGDLYIPPSIMLDGVTGIIELMPLDVNSAVAAGMHYIGKRYAGKPVRIYQILVPDAEGRSPKSELHASNMLRQHLLPDENTVPPGAVFH